jgi:hypothetical protein
MNAPRNVLARVKARVVPLEVPDADDARDMEWDQYVEARQAYREALGRKFSPLGAKKTEGSI